MTRAACETDGAPTGSPVPEPTWLSGWIGSTKTFGQMRRNAFLPVKLTARCASVGWWCVDPEQFVPQEIGTSSSDATRRAYSAGKSMIEQKKGERPMPLISALVSVSARDALRSA